MLGKTFNVAVEIYHDPETDIDYVLPDSVELENLERIVADDEEEAKLFISTNDPEQTVIGKGRLAACSRMRKDIEKRRKLKEAYKGSKNTTKTIYTLKIPTYGTYLSAESEARTTNEDGIANVDESVLMKCLLVESLQQSDAMELPPNIAKILYNHLRRRSFPDMSLLPFPSDAN